MIFPDVTGWMPIRHFINVDFPAPFSPIRVWTVPGRTCSFTPFKAFTPGNSFTISCISRTYSSLKLRSPLPLSIMESSCQDRSLLLRHCLLIISVVIRSYWLKWNPGDIFVVLGKLKGSPLVDRLAFQQVRRCHAGPISLSVRILEYSHIKLAVRYCLHAVNCSIDTYDWDRGRIDVRCLQGLDRTRAIASLLAMMQSYSVVLISGVIISCAVARS